MFGLGILDAIKIGAGATLGVLVFVGPAYLYGKHEGRQQVPVAVLESSAKVLRERSQIDDTIFAGAAASLCADFGLPDDEAAECVRRLVTPDVKP